MASEPIAYWNGQFVPYSQATLALHDAGFVFGATVTDRFRTFNRHLFRVEDHVQRFHKSCQSAQMPLLKTPEEILGIISEIIEENQFLYEQSPELAIILIATPGPIGSFIGLHENGPPTFGVYVFPLSFERLRPLIDQGARLTLSHAMIPSTVIAPSIKHRSRLHWWIAEQKQKKEYDPSVIPLYCTEGAPNWVRETSIANFLAVINGKIVSPPRSEILNGIALQVVEEIAFTLQIPFQEREISVEEIFHPQVECLLTNSTFGIIGVSQIESIPKEFPGILSERLLESYSKCVELDIHQQILHG
jgi:branched-chain amino acid aminotransferase